MPVENKYPHPDKPGVLVSRQRLWQLKNPEKTREQRNKYRSSTVRGQPVKDYQNAYYQEHRERIKARQLEYNKLNREEINRKRREQYQRKKKQIGGR